VHQVGNQPRLYYDAQSINHQHLTGAYIMSWQHVSVVHSTIIRPFVPGLISLRPDDG